MQLSAVASSLLRLSFQPDVLSSASHSTLQRYHSAALYAPTGCSQHYSPNIARLSVARLAAHTGARFPTAFLPATFAKTQMLSPKLQNYWRKTRNSNSNTRTNTPESGIVCVCVRLCDRFSVSLRDVFNSPPEHCVRVLQK